MLALQGKAFVESQKATLNDTETIHRLQSARIIAMIICEGGACMDARKFGAFIAENRKAKNMTQAELAVKLQVTDKAVSRWERGLGFPDINTLEPLAAALDLSILELMKSEKTAEAFVCHDEVENVMIDTLDVAISQKREERKKVLYILAVSITAVALLLAVDSTGWEIQAIAFFVFAVLLPLFGAIAGAVLLGYGIWRKAHHRHARQTLWAAVICFIIAIFPCAAAFALVLLGGFPVPN